MKITSHVPETTCIHCGVSVSFSQEVKTEGGIFWGVIQCQACSSEYEQAWPVSHLSRFSLNRKQDRYQFDTAISWIGKPLQSGRKGKATFSSEKRSPLKQVRIFNCLDTCYGHAVLKLFQVFPWLKQSDVQVVVLIPEVIQWMVPQEVAGVVSVQASLSELQYSLEGFDGYCDSFFLETEGIQIDPLPLNFDYGALKVSDFIGETQNKLTSALQATILWRDDRFWMNSQAGEVLAMVYYKFRWKWLKSFLLRRQAHSYRKVVEILKKEYPGLKVSVIGMASNIPVLAWAEDLRILRPSPEQEKLWCSRYAESDLVIGVHGSHMLLPSLLAGGMINLIPDWKITHQGEDVLFLKSDLDRRTKLRFISSISSVKRIAEHAKSMLGWWKKWYR